jgi:cation transport regulator ChaB
LARGNRPLIRASLPATMRNQLVGLAFSQPSSALNQVNNQYDDRDYEQEMDQAAANVAKEAKKPEHDQDDNYSPEHGIPFG